MTDNRIVVGGICLRRPRRSHIIINNAECAGCSAITTIRYADKLCLHCAPCAPVCTASMVEVQDS